MSGSDPVTPPDGSSTVGPVRTRGRVSAGLLLYRRRPAGPELLLVHMGGPFWARKDEGAWTVPKGLVEPGEGLLEAARREFSEETGLTPPALAKPLATVVQASGKRVHVFAAEGDADPRAVRSNSFQLEWPPRSGRFAEFLEIDRADWFAPDVAPRKLVKGQVPLVGALLTMLADEARG